MKRLLLFVAVATFAATPLYAAPKTIPTQLGSIFYAPSASEAMVLSGKNAVFLSNRVSLNSDVVLTSLDQSGVQIWQRIIDSGVDEVATAMTTDPLANIWVAGSSAALPVAETPTVIAGIDNPDSVSLDGERIFAVI